MNVNHAPEDAARGGRGATSLPPLFALDAVARALDEAAIEWALGGSALLHGLGLARHVGDWDLTTDATPEAAAAALGALSPKFHGNLGIHADHKLTCFDGAVEVICGFAFFGGRGVIRIPTRITGRWRGYPLGSPEAWTVAYTLLIAESPARAAKAEALFEHLREHGDASRIRAMLAQPLPEALAERLQQLLTGSGS